MKQAIRRPARSMRKSPEEPWAPRTLHSLPYTGTAPADRSCACGGDCPRCRHKTPAAAHLAISKPGDESEREADRIADYALRMPGPAANRRQFNVTPTTRHASATGQGLPPVVRDALADEGVPLEPTTRAFFESRFGSDLSKVRIHSGTRTAASLRRLHADAYTVGTHIVVGTVRVGGNAGKRLLAHELSHVLQQEHGHPLIQRQGPAGPTCNGASYDPATECCCNGQVLRGACGAPSATCANATTRDNEYDGCSVPKWLQSGYSKDNPAGASDTWFSDPSIPSRAPGTFVPTYPCDVHDKCYQTCGKTKEECDEQLFKDAEAVCAATRGDGTVQWECTEAVVEARRWLPLKSKPFEDRQDEYCACCPSAPVPPQPVVNPTTLPARSIPTIWFELDSAELSTNPVADSEARLKLAVSRVKEQIANAGGQWQVTVHGYASTEGNEQHNVELSEARASRIAQVLIANGIESSRITIKGHGPDQSRPGLEFNRRVEIEVSQ
jgi:outer membrane protein OmpA-like peptidoglycan-associated protein